MSYKAVDAYANIGEALTGWFAGHPGWMLNAMTDPTPDSTAWQTTCLLKAGAYVVRMKLERVEWEDLTEEELYLENHVSRAPEEELIDPPEQKITHRMNADGSLTRID